MKKNTYIFFKKMQLLDFQLYNFINRLRFFYKKPSILMKLSFILAILMLISEPKILKNVIFFRQTEKICIILVFYKYKY
jgi:hypothetical protein